MPRILRALVGPIVVMVAIALGGLVYVTSTGLRGQPSPGNLETRLARAVRGLAIPSESKARQNPLPASPEALTAGMEHFARYCAMCHANNGSGEDTPIGRGLFPKPPDMRAATTQSLTDGELLYIIVNGVRFTGMPAFGTGNEDAAGEELAWQLVHFVRRLPRITAEEIGRMELLNPL